MRAKLVANKNKPNAIKIISSSFFATFFAFAFLISGKLCINSDATSETAEEQIGEVKIINVSADMDFLAEQCLFSDGYYSLSDTTPNVTYSHDFEYLTPTMEKIATDYVEPDPIVSAIEDDPIISRSTRTFEIRQYTAEEIAANILTPYKTPVDTDYYTWYTWNMVDAVATPTLTSLQNDEDLYLMAKIIHAEDCVLGDLARRCVGTVLINRVWNDDHPDTLEGVVYESNQFSTAYTSLEPCDECISAAYDIIYNGYRAFPHYVDSFQAYNDSYFSNHLTYIAFNTGRFKTYFSYRSGKTIYTEAS